MTRTTYSDRPGKDGRISAVMVSYMTGPALMEAVRGIQRDPDIFELIIIDNGNPRIDRARIWEVASRTENVRLVQGHGNIGFAAACNYGAALADGDYLLFINPDAILESGAARQMARAGDLHTRPWITGGMLFNAAGREQRGGRRGVLSMRSAIASFTPLHRLPGIASMHRENEPLPSGPALIPTVSGALMLMDRQSFNQLGGFDEAYFLHVEDIEICRRARDMGGDVIFVPGACAFHYGSTSEVTRWRVEMHKLRGLIRYFWTSGPGFGAKLGTILIAPLMAAALMARTVWLSLRKAVTGR